MKYGNFPKFCLYVCLFLVAFLLVNALLIAIYDLTLIEKVEVYCIHDHLHGNKKILTPGEAAKLLTLYHTAPFAGEASREPPCSTSAFTVYYRFGNKISVYEAGEYLIVRGNLFDQFFNGSLIRSEALTSYLYELLQCDHK